MPHMKLRLVFDGFADGIQANLALLAEAAERSESLLQLVLDLGDLAGHLRFVQFEAGPAVPACEVHYRLEFSERLAGLLAAVRAGDFDLG